MGDKIAGSRVEVLRGCGHWTPIEKPEECAALLRRFYAQRRKYGEERRDGQRLFTNVRIIDGSGSRPTQARCSVQGNRIAR